MTAPETTTIPVDTNTNIIFPHTAENLDDWTVSVSSGLKNAVPAKVNRTVITFRTHQIIIERQDKLYRIMSFIENGVLIALTAFFVAISIFSIIFTFSILSNS